MSEARAADADGTRHERLADELVALEDRFEYDIEATLDRATEIERAADELHDVVLRLRARLVTASMWRRTGDLAAAARACWEVNAWAAEHDNRALLCRSHVQLSGVYDGLGNAAAGLEHAVCAVGFLDDDTAPRARAYCLMRLGDALAISGSFEAARERYGQAEQVIVENGDVDLQIVILNNLAYSDQLAGDVHRSWATVQRIRKLAAASGEQLKPSTLDTIARIEIALGRYAEAEATARHSIERLDPAFGTQDADSLAECRLTLATAQRHRMAIAAAQATLDACVALCDKSDLAAIRVRATQEQAELYAAVGDFGRAFSTHKAFYAAYQELLCTQREAQARTRQVIFEVAEARQDAERFREQARRDPLTGLRNRRFVDERLPPLLQHAARTGSPVTVAILDIDHFKRINDTYSHDAGDQVLVTFAGLLAGTVRGTDTSAAGAADRAGFAARIGGEEFLLVITDVGPVEAVRRLDDLRRAVAAHPWQQLIGTTPITVSVGVTVSQSDSTHVGVLARADENLYTAKHHGRNRLRLDPAVTLGERRSHRAGRRHVGGEGAPTAD